MSPQRPLSGRLRLHIPDEHRASTAPDKALAVATTSHMTGLETRFVLAFDPHDGSLLSAEQILTGDVGKLNVESPAVISYTLFDQDDAS